MLPNPPRVLADRGVPASSASGRPGPRGSLAWSARTAPSRGLATISRRLPELTPDDRELAARLVAGDEAALREAYRTHAAAVHGLALRVLSNEALAEEIVQDVFVRLWEQPGAVRREPRPAARVPSVDDAQPRGRAGAVGRVAAPPARRARAATDRRPPTIPRVLLETDGSRSRPCAPRSPTLPEAQRVPIEMAYFDGLSYREVARRARRSRRNREVPHSHGDAEVARRAASDGGRAVTDAWDDEDRAIARALGVDAARRRRARRSIDAVADYEAVLAALPFDEVAPAPELEDRMVAAALARRPAAARSIDRRGDAGEPARARFGAALDRRRGGRRGRGRDRRGVDRGPHAVGFGRRRRADRTGRGERRRRAGARRPRHAPGCAALADRRRRRPGSCSIPTVPGYLTGLPIPCGRHDIVALARYRVAGPGRIDSRRVDGSLRRAR